MNDLINDLYQEIILDHGREPRNFGECEPHIKVPMAIIHCAVTI